MNDMKREMGSESLSADQVENETNPEEASETWDIHVETAEEVRQRVRSASAANAIIIQPKPKPTIHDASDKNVAVYGRVSTNSKEQVSSIENQYRYYDEKIKQTPNWHKQKIYMDEGKSGTSMRHREAFKEMLSDAQSGVMDLILCASVSRFARNVADCMTQVRLLRTMHPNRPIGVYFETENIYTLDPEAEKQLGMHALLADWESKNKSSRMILSYDQRIVTGQYPVLDLLGYRHTKSGGLIIVEEEAKTIRFAFISRLLGYSLREIADELTEKQRPSLTGKTEWNTGMVRGLFLNERRWGDLQARKSIVIDMVDRKVAKNNGDRVAAFVEGHHKGIVTKEIAMAVQFLTKGKTRCTRRLPTTEVVTEGALRGFASLTSGCGTLTIDMLADASKSVYSDEEIATLEHELAIRLGKEHSNVASLRLNGYEIPPEAYFVNRSVSTLTISANNMTLNATCRKRLENCTFVEVLYHPFFQVFAIRACEEECVNSIPWKSNNGLKVPMKQLCADLFDEMGWNSEWKYRFRGVSRRRGDSSLILFRLEEPVILGNNLNQNITPPSADEWSDQLNRRFEKMSQRLTEEDIITQGNRIAKPIIGTIPSQEELEKQRAQLLLSM